MALNSLDKILLLHCGLKTLCDVRLDAQLTIERSILVSKIAVQNEL
jgi:hypothetical protein